MQAGTIGMAEFYGTFVQFQAPVAQMLQKQLRTFKGADCCGSQIPVILFKSLQLSGICFSVCSTFSCANYVPVDSLSRAWTLLYAHSLFLLLLF